MSLSMQKYSNSGAELLEKVITSNDLAGLSSVEKVQHIKNICESLGLNPLTKPIQLLKFQGKEIAYFTKEATEQLRKNNNVSITNIENKIIDGVYIVTAYARTPDDRTDASTGAIAIAGLRGEALCNAMLKAETKAKRRVTLSICGLGFIDESEAQSITDSGHDNEKINHTLLADVSDFMVAIEKSETEDQLKSVFFEIKKYNFKSSPELLKKLIDAKDKRKDEIIVKEFNKEIDGETGEVIS